MNERILELWSQAGGHYNSGNQHTWPEYTIDDPKKFAELIVQECAKFTFKYTSDEKNIQEYNQVGWDFLSGDLRNAIEEHFGVNK
jgi:hypothetical protein